MTDLSKIKEHANVIGADGASVGTVDAVEGAEGNWRIKLTKVESGAHKGHHHYISQGLIAGVDSDGTVRLSASGANALFFEEEK